MASNERTSPARPPLFDRRELVHGLARVGRGLLAVASAVVGEDLMRSGRTLKRLGLDALNGDEMRKLLDKGFDE